MAKDDVNSFSETEGFKKGVALRLQNRSVRCLETDGVRGLSAGQELRAVSAKRMTGGVRETFAAQ